MTILYDFDGTIADDLQEIVKIWNQLARERNYKGSKEISEGGINALRSMDAKAAMKALGVPLAHLPSWVAAVRSRLAERIALVKPFVGLVEVLKELKTRQHKQGIVTSNSEDNVREFLCRNDLDIFDLIHSGSSVFGKGRVIKKLLAREGLDKRETVYVGDEIRDVEAACASGIKSIAVTWGANSREILVRARPDSIIDKPEELLGVIEKI
ncbi:MAG: HAD-IA family hydrolase [Patescibacteria group bacterium]